MLIAVATGLQAAEKATVFAHYSFWYTMGESTAIGSWPPDELAGKLFYPMPRYPLLRDEGSAEFGSNHGFGGYAVTGASNIGQHIAWAKQYGIDVFSLLWDGRAAGRFTPSVDDFRRANTGMPWIIFYDTNIRFGHIGICSVSNRASKEQPCSYDLNQLVRVEGKIRTAGDVMSEDFKFMKRRGWIDDPNYFRVDGRPVVWIYQAYLLTDESEKTPGVKRWSDYISEIREWYWTNYHTEIFLVGDMVLPRAPYSPQWDPRITQFDAVTGWSPYYGGCPHEPDCDCCRPHTVADLDVPAIATWAQAVPTKQVSRLSGGLTRVEFVPFITPQFDDQWTKGAKKARMIARSKGEFRYLATVLGLDFLSGKNWLFLSTFNAWPEGTTVEPTCDWKSDDCGADYSNDKGLYGFDFLEVIRELFGAD